MQPNTVGEVVRLLRNRRRLEQIELARACGWRDASAVSRIETDRIRPTRRTLLKLAESLSGDGTDLRTVRGWLFLAAGVLPTDPEGGDVVLPDLDAWPHPAMIRDFGWYVWRSNDAFRRAYGIADLPGRHLVELLFERGTAARAIGASWDGTVSAVISDFRSETDRRAREGWHKRMLERLRRFDGFSERWESARSIAPPSIGGFAVRPSSDGERATITLPFLPDPRFRVVLLLDASRPGMM